MTEISVSYSMSESNKKNLIIKKYAFYACLKGLERGIGIILFEENDDEVKGIKLGIGKTEKIKMNRKTFEDLLSYEYIEYVELLPKSVWKEYKKLFDG